jgi:hypothetical protein
LKWRLSDFKFDYHIWYIKGTLSFSDSKPHNELLQNDRIQIVRLAELQCLAGRTQFQIPLTGVSGRVGTCIAKSSFGGNRHFLTCSWAPNSPVWGQSCISSSVLAVETDVEQASGLHLSPGTCHVCLPL